MNFLTIFLFACLFIFEFSSCCKSSAPKPRPKPQPWPKPTKTPKTTEATTTTTTTTTSTTSTTTTTTTTADRTKFCGKVAMSRISHGQSTTIEKYPWTVSLQFPKGNHYCGAALINEQWLLTAGHCVKSARDYTPFDEPFNLGDRT